MQQEQKKSESFDPPVLSRVSSECRGNVKWQSFDNSNFRIYPDGNEDDESAPAVEIRHAVHCSVIFYTIFFVLILIGAEVYLILAHHLYRHELLVLRYVLIPFGIWILISMSTLIFRWQSRMLMMTGYLEFYRHSSKVWKRCYVISSTAIALGTTFFIVAQESVSPDIYIPGVNDSALTVMFIFWCVVFFLLLWQYICLLVDYLRHNHKRMLPDGVNPSDYRSLPGEICPGAVNEDSKRKSYSLSNGQHATLQRQAVTIRYLEKQVKVLADRLQTQPAEKLVSRSLDDNIIDMPSSCSMMQYQQLCLDKQLLESKCRSFRFQLQSKHQDILSLEHELDSVQGIRKRLQEELKEMREVLTSKQAKIKELVILLAVEREAADQARILIEELSPQNTRAKMRG